MSGEKVVGKHTLLLSVAVLATGWSSLAFAQEDNGTAPAPAPVETPADTDDIIVTGLRASLETAQAIKRNSGQIVDSIVAEDIGKLPDVTVAEALQRITGVQISRNQGEGAGIAIRGLTQVQTLLDGRSIFTAGGGRGLSYQDVPSELLAGADVYKSASADQIEGGIGGVVDLRLRKPLDSDGLEVAGQARGTYYDYRKKTEPTFSGLVSNRWDTGVGDIGALFAGSYQKGSYRADDSASEAFRSRTDAVDANGNGIRNEAADAVLVPGGSGFQSMKGERVRIGFNGSVQWRPSDDLEVYADGYYNKFKVREDWDLLYGLADGATVGLDGPIALAPGTRDFQSGTLRNVQLLVGPFIGDRTSSTWQSAGGVKWKRGAFSVHSDLAYTRALTTGAFLQIALVGTAPRYYMDLSTPVPSFTPQGIDLTDPANFRFDRIAQSLSANRGSEVAWNNDATYQIDGGFLSSIQFGFRYADRTSRTESVFTSDDGRAVPLSSFPEGLEVVNLNLLNTVENVSLPNRYLTPRKSLLRDFDVVRQRFGLRLGGPAFQPEAGFALSEETLTGYGLANLDLKVGGIRMRGNVGARIVRTNTSSDGFITNTSGGVDPLSVKASYTNVLPSFNLKADLTSQLVVRVAASKVLTRPDFSQLTPTVQLQPIFSTGSGGNSALGPIKANQYDLSLEYYISKSSNVYAAGFIKDVEGFITNVVTSETINGTAYLIGRPQNGQSGKIRGAEVGWNQFLDFLPAPFDGFGFQANYTYVFSEGPSPLTGIVVPLQGLSKHSYNLVGLYEKGPISLRAAYNWRSKFIAGIGGGGSGFQPDTNAGGGFLDASASYDVGDSLTLFVDGANLLRTRNFTYFGATTRPHNIAITDRRLGFGARIRF